MTWHGITTDIPDRTPAERNLYDQIEENGWKFNMPDVGVIAGLRR